MRPRRLSYTLSALSVSGFVSAATGAGPFATIAGAPADGLGHQVTLASTANLSAINMMLTGLDAEGRLQTETVAGPNNNIVTSTRYFKTLTSIAASATLGANTMNIGWNAAIVTPIHPVDRLSVGGASMSVGVGGAITYTCQQTVDNPFIAANAPNLWLTLGTVAQTASQTVQAPAGITGLRVQVASHISGVLTINYSQGA